MASKTPKGGAGKNGSPSKNSSKAAGINQSQFQQQDGPEYVVLDKELVRGLSEKEVEIEHLKTTVVALNEKVEVISIFNPFAQVINDMKQDV